MRRSVLLPLVLLFALSMAGCRSSPPPPAHTELAGRSLADMEAEYAKLRAQYLKDCIDGTPELITANQPLCARERERMAPLGNQIFRREQQEPQHATNP